MNDRDQDLDELLAPLKRLQPEQRLLHRWKNAVDSVSKRKWYQLRMASFPELASALALGFVIGMMSFTAINARKRSLSDNIEPSATVEQIYAKSE
jgi:hypothetical protein